MNCRVRATPGGELIVSITLSHRNIQAMLVDPRPISRVTDTADGVRVSMFVACEDDATHYHSQDRDEQFRGQAGTLDRFGEEEGDFVKIDA